MREFLEKYGLRLLIITTVCAVLISVLSFVSATSGFLQNAVGVLTYPFRSAVTAVATWAEDKQRYYKDYSDLIAENEALRERVAELERDARQAEADRAENALLRELLELREQRRDLTFESAAVIDRESVRVLPIFDLIAQRGSISERDMFNTFNMGVGMSIVVAEQDAYRALALLREQGEDAYVIGHIERSEDKITIR